MSNNFYRQLTTSKESLKDAVVNFVGDKAKTLSDIARKKVMAKTGCSFYLCLVPILTILGSTWSSYIYVQKHKYQNNPKFWK